MISRQKCLITVILDLNDLVNTYEEVLLLNEVFETVLKIYPELEVWYESVSSRLAVS